MLSRLAIMLIEAGIVTAEDVDTISKNLGPGEIELAEHLVGTGAPEELITELLADIYSVAPIYLNEVKIPHDISKVLSEETARKFIVLPVKEEDKVIYLAMADPGNLYAIDEVKFQTGKEIVVNASAPSAIRRYLDELYGKADDLVTVKESLDEYNEEEDNLEVVESLEVSGDFEDEEEEDYDDESSDNAPVIKFVNDLISTAVIKEVSDIHVEPLEKFTRIRYRQDGACQVVGRVPKSMQRSVISRLKIMANMNIAERRKTQDGRIKARIDGRSIDFRVSAVPALNGEKIVLRILDKGSLEFDLRELGFPGDELEIFLRGVNSPYGIVLVTGPTGSGKTTTLYSALSSLNTPAKNIHTAEDPIEYNIDGLIQTQINPLQGYNFAGALKAILRQDPNIIMVGEIRDYETASIAMKAAMTGHLVFSTIHTNDAPSTISRLVDIGVKPFLVASAVNVIMAQRLLRKICKKCRKRYEYPEELILESGLDLDAVKNAELFKGSGCKYCGGKGYKGRTGIYEVMEVGKELREAIMNRAPSGRLRVLAVERGMKTLRMDAVDKFLRGISTLEEINKRTAVDENEVIQAKNRFDLRRGQTA